LDNDEMFSEPKRKVKAMIDRPVSKAGAAGLATLLLGVTIALTAGAQTPSPPPAPPAPSPAQQAIDARQAVYKLIGQSFGPLGRSASGQVPFDPSDAVKRADRLAFLATFLPDEFPDISQTGNTKARPEIWTDQADFAKRQKDLIDHTAKLAQVLHQDDSNSDAFKAAVKDVGADCKGCHDNYRVR
jgi:cytochrome c556